MGVILAYLPAPQHLPADSIVLVSRPMFFAAMSTFIREASGRPD
jgi:hypothetical protein